MDGTYRRFAYDGTYEGFLCVAVKCINLRVIPEQITVADGTIPGSEVYYVRTNYEIACKMHKFICDRACIQVSRMVIDGFLTAMPDREITLIRFIAKAIRFGACVADNYDDQAIYRIHMAILDLYREEQSFFMDFNPTACRDVMASVINPRNMILPVMKNDILRKTEYDNIFVYDRRHHMILYRNDEINDIVDVRNLVLHSQSEASVIYDDIWQYLKNGEHLNGQRRRSVSVYGRSCMEPERMWYVAV